MSRFLKTDKLFRAIILKERLNKCEHCGKRSVLHISHILPKGSHPRLRYQRCNVLLLCVRCHLFWAHRNPLDFTHWVEEYKGKELFNSLRILEKTLPKIDLKLLALCLEEELK